MPKPRATRSNQPTRRTLARRIGNIRAATKGRVLRLSADPPKFTQIPWWQIIISDEPTLPSTTKEYTATTIKNIFVAQIGLVTTSDLSFRLQRIEVWNLSGNPVNLEVQDFTVGFGANDFLVQAEDVPGRNRWARVGYSLPTSQQLIAFSSGDSDSLFKVSATKGDKLQVRVRLLWKPRVHTAPNSHTQLKTRVEQLEQQLATLMQQPPPRMASDTNRTEVHNPSTSLLPTGNTATESSS